MSGMTIGLTMFAILMMLLVLPCLLPSVLTFLH